MKKLKTNFYDTIIIFGFICWIIYEFFITKSHEDTVLLCICVALIFIFPSCCSRTEKGLKNLRYNALIYSFSVLLAIGGALKLTELSRDIVLVFQPVKLLFTGVFLQSAFFLLKPHTKATEEDKKQESYRK